MWMPYRNNLKAYISLTTVQIWKRLSLYDFWMNEEHFKLINEFLNFLVNNAFLTENHKFLEIRQTSLLTFGYPGFQKKKRFCDELIFKTRVKVNVHPLRFWLRLILVVTVLWRVLEKLKKAKQWNFYTECMNKWPIQVCQKFEITSTGGVPTWRRKRDP